MFLYPANCLSVILDLSLPFYLLLIPLPRKKKEGPFFVLT
jgi:hypothetical protein